MKLNYNYFRLQIILTNANSAIDANMNIVQPMNHISLAFMYDTFGNVFVCPDANVINDNIVDVPKSKIDISNWHIFCKIP